jgi:Flp pilus assembly pilin Flp
MHSNPVLALLASVTATLRGRAGELRRNPERGSHAVEYAIGVGLGAAIILAVYAAYRNGVLGVVATWMFH